MILAAGMIAIVTAFALSAAATPVAGRLATRYGMLDVPGRHKAHARAVPLLGGCAIFAAILLPSLLVLALASLWTARPEDLPHWLPDALRVHIRGVAFRGPMAVVILVGALLLHVVGLIDDAKVLGAWPKLLLQLAIATGVVLLAPLRVLTLLGEPWSAILTVLWLTAITNAINFMDNMDGLAAGVSAICAAALLAAAASIGQWFVAGWACLILGASAGFLPHNFPPAKIFMGDAGSTVLGYFLAVVSCLTTYVHPGTTHSLYVLLAPLVVLAVPLYDMASVLFLRLKARQSPMVGDRRHFSHRLAKRGMGPRAVALTVYLCTTATAVLAALLPRVDEAGALLVLALTVIILAIIAVLETPGG